MAFEVEEVEGKPSEKRKTAKPKVGGKDLPANDNVTSSKPKSVQSKGGEARAEKLSGGQRKLIAATAAEARWGNALPVAEHAGELAIGGLVFPCAVLSDGTRVLTETDFMAGMGMYRSGALSTRRKRADDGGARAPLYLAFKNLEPFVDKHLGDVHEYTYRYRTLSGNVATGIKAEMIPKICDIWLDARSSGVLGPRQVSIAAKAEILVRGLANVGIVALVDEATGFQYVRAKDSLNKILEAFIAKELRKWVKTFPIDYYRELYRLMNWQFNEDSQAKPSYVGKLTNDFVYSRLAPGVLEELKRQTPKLESGRRKHHFHRHLSEDFGHPRLREHLSAVITLMKVCDSMKEFEVKINRALPPFHSTMELDLRGGE